jgi:hypothetical protein
MNFWALKLPIGSSYYTDRSNRVYKPLYRCGTCKQILDENGQFSPSFDQSKFTEKYGEDKILSEKKAVKDPRISVSGLDSGELPNFLLDEFSFYDKKGKLVFIMYRVIGLVLRHFRPTIFHDLMTFYSNINDFWDPE